MKTLGWKLRSICYWWRRQFVGDETPGEGQQTLSLLVRVLSVLVIYVVLDRVLMRVSRLPLESYTEPFIYLAFLKQLLTGWFMILIPAALLLIVTYRSELLLDWTDLPRGSLLRILILTAAGILAWSYSTYNYNLFFDRGHYADRLLLVVLLALVYLRPVFVLPFLTVLLPVIWQFAALSNFSWAAPYIPIRILILFVSFLLIYLPTRKFRTADFVFLTGCLVAAHYWTSGFAKLDLNWIRYNQIFFMLPDRHASGWLPFLSAETVGRLTEGARFLNYPLKIGTLIVEFGVFLFFFNRHTSRFFLLGWIGFHSGVFLVTGFFFWKWMLIESVLLWLFVKRDGFSELPIFTRKHLAISVVLIVGGTFWVRPVTLAWFDVPIKYRFTFEAETASGQTYHLPSNFFAPYDYQFSLETFGYLGPEPVVPFIWGVTQAGATTTRELMRLETPEEIFDYEHTKGVVYFSKGKTQAFDRFLNQFIGNWNRRHSNETFLSWIQPPRLLLTYPKQSGLPPGDPIRRVRVIQVTVFYRDGLYREIRRAQTHHILISDEINGT